MIDLEIELRKKNNGSYYVKVQGIGNTTFKETSFHPFSFIIGYANWLMLVSPYLNQFVYTSNSSLDGKIVTFHDCTYFITLIKENPSSQDYLIQLDQI